MALKKSYTLLDKIVFSKEKQNLMKKRLVGEFKESTRFNNFFLNNIEKSIDKIEINGKYSIFDQGRFLCL